MTNYPILAGILRSIFNVEHGLSDDEAIRLYVRSTINDGILENLKCELRAAFSDGNLSWMDMLNNSSYEVLDADTEETAKKHAIKILWDPISSL